MLNPSPLRYPGGKFKISRLISWLILQSKRNGGVYIEPFAGGAGVALELLLSNVVSRIVINDYDKAIYSFWRAVVSDGENLLDRIVETPVTMDQWEQQRRVYQLKNRKYSLDLAFATFFLNRTNHSGVLMDSGPIGGRDQREWKLDARYNKHKLIDKIMAIIARREKIIVYNKDVMRLLDVVCERFCDSGFMYLDPPYYRKGRLLYKNAFTHVDHMNLAKRVRLGLNMPWVVSYDDEDEIRQMYKGYPFRRFTLGYSLANNGRGREIMFFSSSRNVPSERQIINLGLHKQFKLS